MQIVNIDMGEANIQLLEIPASIVILLNFREKVKVAGPFSALCIANFCISDFSRS